MGNQIFISYKYGDRSVFGSTKKTARDYTNTLQKILKSEDHVNKGEPDDLDLSQLSDETIQDKLATRMFYSTVTIVMISPNMKKEGVPQRDQWIPWEIAYSLRTENRAESKSYPNAMIAVVLPDVNGLYGYYMKEHKCKHCNVITYKTDTLFPILGDNMFNAKQLERTKCSHCNESMCTGEYSYIDSITWDDFIEDIDTYIEEALERQRNREDYKIYTKLQ